MCTGVRLFAKDASVLYGRTLEFGYQTDSAILFVPRNYLFEGKTGTEKKGFCWKSLYACVGANMMNEHEFVDGVNEKGLAAGLFYFPGYAEYQNVLASEYDSMIAPWQMASLVLTLCATVQEARALMARIKVGAVFYNDQLGVPPLHMIVHDNTGASVVFEYIDGELCTHENLLGVITNAPDFVWHRTNLNNYVHILGTKEPRKNVGGLDLHPFGAGAGTLGIPGDFTPPSRFVRAAFLSGMVIQGENADQVKDAAFHILNSFDIPKGVVCTTDHKGQTIIGYTQWTAVSDLTNRIYYWHTYQNRQVSSIQLKDMDLTRSNPLQMPMK